MATKNARKVAPHTRCGTGTRARKALAVGAEQRMFLAVDVAAAALMGRREGYAEACATQALKSTVAVLDGFTSARPKPADRLTKLDDSGKELPADAMAWSQVRDNETGLIWAADTIDGTHKWKAAQAAARRPAKSSSRRNSRTILCSSACWRKVMTASRAPR